MSWICDGALRGASSFGAILSVVLGVRSENPICLNPMTVAGWECGSREKVRPRRNATLHGPNVVLNVDWDRMANTLCFQHDRVFGHYAASLISPKAVSGK
jgi:hypothetical protein